MSIFFGENGFSQLSLLMDEYDKIFILTDERINKLYASLLASVVSYKVIKIVIPEGENNKTIDNVCCIWSKMLENHAGRDSLLINFGGGTISDIGAFAASTYKRGIDFVNIPTTLLAMVDASIGGKNAINFNNIKNQIGLFSEPNSILINHSFLNTLDRRDILSGLAEMMKYAFIADASFLKINNDNYLAYIEKAALLKEDIVNFDMNEKGIRKMLNFGHTVGHALETFFMEKNNSLTHGEAVALGMYSALFLSINYCGMDKHWFDFYENWLRDNYKHMDISGIDEDVVLSFISHDKKNIGGEPRFVLISEPEKAIIDVEVKVDDIRESISILRNIFRE
ncbi:MAG: 3-dehydroquinate synthase [Lentimicrobiaceae bacterium]|nr:3-dehydroquinate synthase [Lentimicrobiaceae bacterium]